MNMSAVAGGERRIDSGRIPPSYTLGRTTEATIDGRTFSEAELPWLRGTLRFDAPSVVLSAPVGGRIDNFATPFTFTGQVTGFAHDDLDARAPLFHRDYVGQGTVFMETDFDAATGTYQRPVAQ
jgi:hypothetical protein